MNERNNTDHSISTFYINALCLVLAAIIFLSFGIFIGIMIERHNSSESINISTEPTLDNLVLIDTYETIATLTESTEEPIEEPTEEPIEETYDIYTEPTVYKSISEESEPVSEERSEDIDLMACVIYQEAGSDYICDECRYRVADIVLNRVSDERFPNTIYEVLTQPSQYGNYSKTGVIWPSRASKSEESHAVKRAYEIATNVVNDIKHSSLYGEGYIWQAGFAQGSDGFWCCGHFYGR